MNYKEKIVIVNIKYEEKWYLIVYGNQIPGIDLIKTFQPFSLLSFS